MAVTVRVRDIVAQRTRECVPLLGSYDGLNRLFVLPEPAVHDPPRRQVKVYHGGRRLNSYEYLVSESVPGSGNYDRVTLTTWAPHAQTQLVADYYVAT